MGRLIWPRLCPHPRAAIVRRIPGILVKGLRLLLLLLPLVRPNMVTCHHMEGLLHNIRDIVRGHRSLVLRAITKEHVCTFPSARGQAFNHPLDRPPTTVQTYNLPGGVNFSWQYSQCTGSKKALLVGINYFRQQGELKGCINDVQNVRKFLIGKSFPSSTIIVLTVRFKRGSGINQVISSSLQMTPMIQRASPLGITLYVSTFPFLKYL